MATQRTHGVESARRVLNMLFQFTPDNPVVSIEYLAEQLECSVGSAYRYIGLLRELFLVEEHTRGTYRLTPRVYALADAVDHLRDLKSVARPVLVRLAQDAGETAILVRAIDDAIICVDTVQAARTLRLTFSPGQVLAMHRGASAKVMLSGLSRRQRERYLTRMVQQGRFAEEECGHLIEQLEAIAESGYAESNAEVDAGTWASAAAIKLEGKVIASVSVAAPETRTPEPQRLRIRQLVIEAAEEISRLMQAGSGPVDGDALT